MSGVFSSRKDNISLVVSTLPSTAKCLLGLFCHLNYIQVPLDIRLSSWHCQFSEH